METPPLSWRVLRNDDGLVRVLVSLDGRWSLIDCEQDIFGSWEVGYLVAGEPLDESTIDAIEVDMSTLHRTPRYRDLDLEAPSGTFGAMEAA